MPRLAATVVDCDVAKSKYRSRVSLPGLSRKERAWPDTLEAPIHDVEIAEDHALDNLDGGAAGPRQAPHRARPTPPLADRWSHLPTVRSVTANASAAAAYDHPSCRTRWTIRNRDAGVVLALRWSFIRGLL